MKKFLLIAILLVSFNNIFANMLINQGNWRWRKDDGSETSATWIAAQNTAAVVTSYSDPLRLRVEFYNDPINMGSILTDKILQASSDAGSTWDTVNLVADADDAFVLAGSSGYITDLEGTSQQLSSPHFGTYVGGNEIVSSEKLPLSSISLGAGTEYEYVIKPTLNMQPSTTYFFRVYEANYPVELPSLTTAVVLPVRLTDFSIRKDGKRVMLNWSTASEQNTDRFEVERSSDSRIWSSIAKVKGKRTSNELHYYSSYDEKPINGNNYYRLKLFDFDGHFSVSEIKFLKFAAHYKVITVSPNPAKAAINFKLERGSSTYVSVSLTNADGRQVYNEVMKKINAGEVYRLNLLQQPAPGIYILNLKSEGFNETSKVVIQ